MRFTPALIELYRNDYELICAQVHNLEARALAKLVALGLFSGGESWKLFREYKEWGALHFLLLSGCQFYSFASAWELIVLGLYKFFCKGSGRLLSRLSLVPAIFFYLQASDFSTRLVRCALLWVAMEFLNPIFRKPKLLLVCTFVFHLFIVEGGHLSDSAFLSWLACLTLMASAAFCKSHLCKNLFVSAVLQISIFAVRHLPFSWKNFAIALLGNLAMLPLYRSYLFPCIGVLSVLCTLLSWALPESLNHWILSAFLAPLAGRILDLMLLPLLVAHSAFRYTFPE